MAVLVLVARTLLAQAPPSPAPEPLKEYMGRVIAPTMHYMGAAWLVRHKREREEAATRMREELNLKPGMVVCDLGSGNGYHTLPMAKKVAPDGRVIAVEVQNEMLTMLRQRAEAVQVSNIEYILGEYHDPKLPAASCDLILLVDVYHEFSHPEPMLAAMRRALKPGGAIVLVEFRTEDPEVPIKPEHKMSREQIMKEIPANGFKLLREFHGLPWQHMMWFVAAENAAPPAASGSK
jgi:ubiquinone/menaquinone biosynthesis C-methylase UbiE